MVSPILEKIYRTKSTEEVFRDVVRQTYSLSGCTCSKLDARNMISVARMALLKSIIDFRTASTAKEMYHCLRKISIIDLAFSNLLKTWDIEKFLKTCDKIKMDSVRWRYYILKY